MTLTIPKITKEPIVATGIKGLVGRKVTKQTQFMGESVTISKLSVSQVLEIQAVVRAQTADDEASGFNTLKTVISASVEGGSELTDEDFNGFSMDELNSLSTEIMKFSGIGADQGK